MTIAADVKLPDESFAFDESRRLPRIALTTSIAYAKGARHTLDVCRPKSATAAPVIVFFYGGGWRSGSKRTYRYVAKALARRGYVAVLPDYRIYPQARYPDFLDDGAQAVRWVKDKTPSASAAIRKKSS
jgi:acetyl esterase/lipase